MMELNTRHIIPFSTLHQLHVSSSHSSQLDLYLDIMSLGFGPGDLVLLVNGVLQVD